MDASSRRLRALITGASSGIGRELAGLFARDGYDLVLTARDGAALESLAASLRAAHGVDARVLVEDLSLPGSASRIVAALATEDLAVDVLVNNAGAGRLGLFLDSDLDCELGMMQLNMVSLVELTKPLARAMAKRGSGRILNVSSMGAFQPGPHMAIYYATKAFVQSFSEAIGEELRNSGVTVTALSPGPVRTAFTARAGVPMSGGCVAP